MAEAPKRLGKYEILEELGRGGFATVYKARDTELERLVALKVLHAHWSEDANFAARFRQEARATANLRHPHIVTIYETGEVEKRLYIAMTYLPGRTLRTFLEAEGALPLEQALPILEQMAQALEYAHERGMVHRDVKPGNIIIEETGYSIQATLLDFGLVKAVESSLALTSPGTLLGTPEYMAPEQIGVEDIDWRADIYALGIVAYHMLVGQPPFTGAPTGVWYKHVHEPPPAPRSLNPALLPDLEPILLKALAKSREDRFQRAGVFAAELRRVSLVVQQAQDLGLLYTQLQNAVETSDWIEVLSLSRHIQALDSGYRDVERLKKRAEKEVVSRPSQSFSRRTWLAVGMVALLLLIGLGSLLLDWWPPVGSTGLTSITKATTTATATIAASASLPPTNMPTPRPVIQSDSTATLSPTPTMPTFTPSDLPDLTIEPTLTLDPLVPPPNPSRGDTWTRLIDDMIMVYAPGGAFQMGSTEVEIDTVFPQCKQQRGSGECPRSWFENESPQHQVTLDGFWIDRQEVTNAQFAAFLNERGNQEEGGGTWLDLEEGNVLIEEHEGAFQPKSGFADHPVIVVSWFGAAAYCVWAGGQLPTEAQWEYAARGPDGHAYPWGDAFNGAWLNFCDANCTEEWRDAGQNDGYERTSPVGNLAEGASWVGAFDMAGNVWEWVADWYGEYPTTAQINPTGPETGDSRVHRGGSWINDLSFVRAALRNNDTPDVRVNRIGFRCVVDSSF